MVLDKSSLAPEGEAIAFELGKENGFNWLGHYDISVDDLLSGIPKEKKSEQAENLILEYLSKGKYPQQELLKKHRRWVFQSVYWMKKKSTECPID